MAIQTIPFQHLEIAKGQDWTLQLRVLARETATLDAPALAAATALTVKPLADALSSGDMLIFGKNTVVELSDDAAAGETALAVNAIPGPLSAGDVGQKIADLTGYTVTFEASLRRDQATPSITKSGSLATQTGVDRGKVDIAGLAADTASLDSTTYYWAVWRRNAGTSRPIAEGDMLIAEKGFL